jgi:cytidine deaminase
MGAPYHCFNEITDRQDAATTAKRWGMSKRRVLQLCNEGKVYAAKKIDGEWTIPTVALRPIDGRQHRGFVTPRHLKNILRYADAVVRDIPESERKWSRDAYEYFMRGSAFHLHTLETSHLNFGDVCQVLKGKAVAGKPLDEQMDVVYHHRATSFLCLALEGKRRFSAIAVCGGKDGVVTNGFPPCGVCRQVMREFCTDDFLVYVVSQNEIVSHTLKELFPQSFGPSQIFEKA